ncbi:MAG TPA: phosphonate ABC transporter, permease protein PhnE [Casimicrobiaceae bacterium]
MASVASSIPAQRAWRRFSPAQRLGRFAIYVAIVAAIVASLRTIEVIPEFLYDAPDQVVDLVTRMWPIAWEHYPKGVHAALMETIHIASLGTLLALLLATPVGILAANRLVPSALVNWCARLILVSSRSVNSLVWALIFVGIFGPGPLAGTLAIAFRSIGFVGKLVGEALDETQPGPIEALRASGAPWLSVLSFGYWPQVKPAFWSIALFRFDINVRESAVLGLVGAGGIGMALDAALNLFQWDRVALILVAMFVVVIAAEVGVTQVRKRML